MGNTTTLPVVEEQLLARLDEALGEDTDAVIAVDHHDFGVAVGVDRVVGEADLVSLARCVHHEIWRNKNGRSAKKSFSEPQTTTTADGGRTVVQVEEERAHVFVVDFAAPVGFVLRDNLAAVLGDELVLLDRLFDKDAPASDVGRRHQQVLAQASLDADVLASGARHVELVGAARLA